MTTELEQLMDRARSATTGTERAEILADLKPLCGEVDPLLFLLEELRCTSAREQELWRQWDLVQGLALKNPAVKALIGLDLGEGAPEKLHEFLLSEAKKKG